MKFHNFCLDFLILKIILTIIKAINIIVRKNDRLIATLLPEKRYYLVQETPTTEAAIDINLFRDLYVVLGDMHNDGRWTVRTYVKPFVFWIWAGAIIMAIGGALSLTDRKYRLGFVQRKKTRVRFL